MSFPLCRDLDLNQLPATPFLAVGHSLKLPTLPALAPAAFSHAEQLADPSAPRTRLVKDVLRAGRWKVGTSDDGQPRWWLVTPETLDQIAANFAAAQANGVAVNLCWGHGDPDTKVVDSRDCIAPLDQVLASGGLLWVTSYVTPQQAAKLRNPAMKVSVRVADGWTDGAGRVYPIMLLHVAVVDQPVMDGQGPFVDLSNRPSRSNRPRRSVPLLGGTRVDGRRQTVDGDGGGAASTPLRGRRREASSDSSPPSTVYCLPSTKRSDHATRLSQSSRRRQSSRLSRSQFVRDLFLQEKKPMPLDFERTRDAVNTLLEDDGVQLPDDVTADNFNDALDLILSVLSQESRDGTGNDASDGAGAASLLTDPTATMSKTLASALAPFEKAVKDLSNEVASLKQGQLRQPYIDCVKELAATGCIDAKTRTQLEATGEKTGYDLSLLDPFKNLKMVDMSRAAKKLASSEAPTVTDIENVENARRNRRRRKGTGRESEGRVTKRNALPCRVAVKRYRKLSFQEKKPC